MFRINKKNKARHEQKYFIGIITSVFILFSIAITGYVLDLIASSSNTTNQMGETFTIVKSYTQVITNTLEKLISGNNWIILGSILSMTILGSAYYFFDTFKSIKSNMTS